MEQHMTLADRTLFHIWTHTEYNGRSTEEAEADVRYLNNH